MSREDGFCRSKSLKSLLCFLKDCICPPQNSRGGFSTGPNRPAHTANIRSPSLPFLGTHQPWAFFSFPGLLSAISCSHYPLLHHILDFPPSFLISLPTTRLLTRVPISANGSSGSFQSITLKMQVIIFLWNDSWLLLLYSALFPRR
jgi:hypothetical protein